MHCGLKCWSGSWLAAAKGHDWYDTQDDGCRAPNRRLVNVSKPGGVWRAEPTDAGQ